MAALSLLTRWQRRLHRGEADSACAVGTVLRAVLAVEAVVAVASLWGEVTPTAWLMRAAWLTSFALPGALIWVLGRCAWQKLAPVRHGGLRVGRDVVLGGAAGAYAQALAVWAEPLGAASWVASVVSGAALAAVLGLLLHWRERARAPAATAARLGELQARIRPHFLFNTLNSAITLVRADPQRAERLLEDLSDLFRAALADSGTSVTLADEVALARRYLDIEQARFGERLRVQWLIDPSADAARLPPLLLQPLVENAVRHGVEPSAGGGDVRIQTERVGDGVRVSIVNTLPAQAEPAGAPGHGLALDNVRQRLSLLHDVQASLRTLRHADRFEVVMAFPA